jgi:hypothetical protein
MALALALPLPAAAGEVDPDVQRLEDEVRKRDDRIEQLERKFDVLADELSKVRTQVAVPEEVELKSQYGLGPAASKIYGVERGLSLGGYGEFFYRNFIGDENSGSDTLPGGTFSDRQLDRADFLRLVTYLGYKFSDSIVFNSEIEFEHAFVGEETASAGSGEVTVEFAALDFFFRDWANARAGLLLLPMGFLNEVHEPPFFHGVSRPETETRILPTTWRENGAGLFGRIGEDLEYRAYVVTGFNGAAFTDAGIRDGRQQANRALAEDFAFVGRLDWTPIEGLLVGGSVYRGDSGQDQTVSATGLSLPNATLTIFEGHAQYRHERLELRGLFAMSLLSDATELNVALGRAANRPVAEEMLGGYAELAYDVGPWLFGDGGKYLAPFLRGEYVDTQFEVPSGFTPNDRNRYWLFTPGITFKPHPNVALKLEYRNFMPLGGEERPDEISLGMGFAF